MPESKKVVCPDCGVEMNRHAEKVNYSAACNYPDAVDPDIGGLIEEAHTCPLCGDTRMLRAQVAATQD